MKFTDNSQGVCPDAPKQENYTESERRYLLDIARKTVTGVEANPGFNGPPISANDVPSRLKEVKACFVTLIKNGAVRGCIGHLEPQESLYLSAIHNARDVVLYDSRYQPGELDRIKIEISVLTKPQPLHYTSPEDLLGKLNPGTDGVLLKISQRRATFLPRVWDEIPDKVEFMNHLSMKAGFAPEAWRDKGTIVSIYHTECFGETE